MNADVVRAALGLRSVILVNARQVIELLVINPVETDLDGLDLTMQISIRQYDSGTPDMYFLELLHFYLDETNAMRSTSVPEYLFLLSGRKIIQWEG